MTMLDIDEMALAIQAAQNPDEPFENWGLPDTDEVRLFIERVREAGGSEIPNEWPTAGNADFLYSEAGSAAALAAAAYGDDEPPSKKVDATLLEAERFQAGLDRPEVKREYVRDEHGRFATVHGGDGVLQRLGTNRHGSGYLEPSDLALVQRHLSPISARLSYNDAYERGKAARDAAGVENSLNVRHEQMKRSMQALRTTPPDRRWEAEQHADTVLDSAGYIDGALGIKRRFRRPLFGDVERGVLAGTIGRVGAVVGKAEWDALPYEEKREYVRDDNGRFAHVPGARYAIGDKVREYGGATLDPDTGEEPTDGFIVAVQGYNQEVPFAEFDRHRSKIVGDYLMARQAEMRAANDSGAKRMLGLWHDKEHDEVVLDVVEQFQDRDAAIAAGKARNQQAIWDVANTAEIDTGGTGDREGKADEAGRTGAAAGELHRDDGGGGPGLRGEGGADLGDEDPAAAFLLSEEKRDYVRDRLGRFADTPDHTRIAPHSGMRVGDTMNDERAQANLHPDPTRSDAIPPQ